jgi:CheY-like chemotaxis protein/HEAT repeat protein
MVQINAEDFLQELRFDIQEKDRIKAKLVLAQLKNVDEVTRKQALQELGRADNHFAVPLMLDLMVKERDLSDQYPDLKEGLYAKAFESPQLFVDLLMREMRQEYRRLLVETVGEIGLTQAMPVLVGILNEEQDEEILRAVIRALGAFGDLSVTTSISEYLYSGSVTLIIAAIQALGQLESPTAIQRLFEKLGADHDLDTLILDVLARSQVPDAIEKLNETLTSHHAHVRNLGKQHLVQIGSKAVPLLMRNLLRDDPDVLIHTLNVLGEIGDEAAIGAIRKLLHNEPRDPNVRFAAYEALGRLPVAKGAITLAAGLQDPVDNVRTVAASAINSNYNRVLAAGLKNMVRESGAEARRVVTAVVDAQCDSVFKDLMEMPAFREMATRYINEEVHAEVRTFFLPLLKVQPLSEAVSETTDSTADDAPAKQKIYAVDDSKMILNIYRSVLHKLGYEPVLFEFPLQAIEQVRQDKPAIILTDLNMPKINGIDLIRQVRQWFDKDQLPIIMVTTQNECQDNEEAHQAGVNRILNKPFTEKSIGQAIAEVQTV